MTMYLKSVGKYTSIYFGDLYAKDCSYCNICKGLLVQGEKILCYLWDNSLDAHRYAHLECAPNELRERIEKEIMLRLLEK